MNFNSVFEFTTDNDSELIAVYLADKLSQGIALKDALATSIDDLDGTFSFLVSTQDEIGYAKDRLAAKPMIMYETEDLIAVASEEVSLNRLFPGLVHNGQITNYWKMRRRLEQRGFEFTTDNDSELIAVYLADKLSQDIALKDALATSIDDLDGTFSFLVSTGEEIGYAKDRLAVKPMIMYENEDLIAVASEEVSLNRLFPGQALDTREPPP